MRLLNIQYFRALAALMVVVYHLQPQLERMGYTVLPASWLMAGVDIFFVISGFIMWWTTPGDRMTPGIFMRRRILRIVPLYWAFTALFVFVLLVAPKLMQSGAFDLPHAIASFFFFPYPHPVTGGAFPVVSPGWTLNFEMYFYVIFALCLFLPRPRRFVALISGMLGMVVLGAVLRPQSLAGAFYTSPLILEFLLGVVIARATERGILMPRIVAPVALVVGFVAIPVLSGFQSAMVVFTEQGARAVTWGIPAGLLIYAAVSIEASKPVRQWDWLLFLGNASFSIYVSHQLTMSAVGQGWHRLIGGGSTLAYFGFCIVGTAACVTAGCMCYQYIEQPLNRWARRGLDATLPVAAQVKSQSGGKRVR